MKGGGGGGKKFGMPFETKLFGGMTREFCRDIPGGPKSSRNKVCVQFSSRNLAAPENQVRQDIATPYSAIGGGSSGWATKSGRDFWDVRRLAPIKSEKST